MSTFIPNSFQVPNSLIDRYGHLLSGDEQKVLIYMYRRIVGFHKRQDRIALSQFTDGLTGRNGEQLDHGVGLSKPTVIKILCWLGKVGFIIITDEGNPARHIAPEYELQLDDDAIDIQALEARAAERSTKNQSRTKEARSKPRLPSKEERSKSRLPRRGQSDLPRNDEAGSMGLTSRGKSDLPVGVSPIDTQKTGKTRRKPDDYMSDQSSSSIATLENPNKTEQQQPKSKPLPRQQPEPPTPPVPPAPLPPPLEDGAFSRVWFGCDRGGQAWLEQIDSPANRAQFDILAERFSFDVLIDGVEHAARQGARSLSYLIAALTRSAAAGKKPSDPKQQATEVKRPAPPAGETESERMARLRQELFKVNPNISYYSKAG